MHPAKPLHPGQLKLIFSSSFASLQLPKNKQIKRNNTEIPQTSLKNLLMYKNLKTRDKYVLKDVSMK